MPTIARTHAAASWRDWPSRSDNVSLMNIIGIDTGGTFTDFVVYDGTSVRVHKTLSTPDAPERAIAAGLAALAIDKHELTVVHGSTVATNAMLEGAGARTVFITNRGFSDTLTIGRQARERLYDLTPPVPVPPVPPDLCLQTGGRLGADGQTLEPLSSQDIAELQKAVAQLKPQAIAISLLFAFMDDRFEREIAAAFSGDVFVTCSSDVLPEYREYERGIATWLNATTGPVMSGYLHRLSQQLKPAALSVMQSSAVTCDPEFAASHAVNLLLSGPAGGLLGARHVAREAAAERILTFDMGGTSTDVALVDGEIRLTPDGRIGRYPVGVPMVDIHTIGAGGGSIARVDAGGLLHVGPKSAGAVPGPACYGAGGTLATVTDANLVLGRIPTHVRLGGHMALRKEAAVAVIGNLARAMGDIPLQDAAQGVVDIANDHMQQALRVISVERGIDPRDFTLVSFGGAGGLHVCALAQALSMRRALVPAHAGVLSALGMVVGQPGRRLSKTIRRPLGDVSALAIESLLSDIAQPAVADLQREGYAKSDMICRNTLDLCYQGQSFALNISWDGSDVAEQFHGEHELRYGHRLDYPVELVNLRVAVDVVRAPVQLPPASVAKHPAAGESRFPLLFRSQLAQAEKISGPAVICDDIATTFVDAGWCCALDDAGNLILELR